METRKLVFGCLLLVGLLSAIPPVHAQYTNQSDDGIAFGQQPQTFDQLGDLAAWWKFDEGTSTNAADSSGNGNNGVLINSPNWVTGLFSNALQFTTNSTDQEVTVNTSGTVIRYGVTSKHCNNLD